MTQLLVSVRSPDEAVAALAGGADWIDIKEPLRGSLGAVDAATIEQIMQVVDGRAPVSMACGELIEGGAFFHIPSGVQLAKCGLARAGSKWKQGWTQWTQKLPLTCQPVLVAYAEEYQAKAPPLADVIAFGIQVRPSAVLIDTAIKDGCTLLDHWPIDRLAGILRPLAGARIPVALAGSLTSDHIPTVMALCPGWIAVRGGVCTGGRNGVVSREKVQRWRDAIHRCQPRLAETFNSR